MAAAHIRDFTTSLAKENHHETPHKSGRTRNHQSTERARNPVEGSGREQSLIVLVKTPRVTDQQLRVLHQHALAGCAQERRNRGFGAYLTEIDQCVGSERENVRYHWLWRSFSGPDSPMPI